MVDINQALQQAAATGQADWYIFLLAFFAGILVSFTPCIYPMIPITAGILQAQAGRSFLHNFFSALSYISGLAVVYATLGYLSATTSLIFGKWLANPWFIGLIIILFMYLAFSMFGFYELYTPSFLSRHTGLETKGSLVKSFLFGMLSGTVASPCLTPALALLLGIVAKQGNPFVGFITLFCFSLGMGILLLLIGTFSSTLALLPRTGAWMDYIKKAFGFLMLASCVYFLQPFLQDWMVMACYTVIAAIAGIFYMLQVRKSHMAFLMGIIALLIALTLGSSIFKMFM